MSEKKIQTAIENRAAFASHLRYAHRIADTHLYRLDYLVSLHDQDHDTAHIHGPAPRNLRKLH